MAVTKNYSHKSYVTTVLHECQPYLYVHLHLHLHSHVHSHSHSHSYLYSSPEEDEDTEVDGEVGGDATLAVGSAVDVVEE